MATDLAKDRAARNLRKQSSIPSGGGPIVQLKHFAGGKYKHSISVASQAQAEAEQQQQAQSMGPAVRLENTYQLGPSATGQFPLGQAGRVLRQILRDYLDGKSYAEEFARTMSQSISQVIRSRMKELQSPAGRYKVISLCSIGARGPHGLSMASRCLWDDSVDNFVSSQFDNNSLYAVATVFVVYQDRMLVFAIAGRFFVVGLLLLFLIFLRLFDHGILLADRRVVVASLRLWLGVLFADLLAVAGSGLAAAAGLVVSGLLAALAVRRALLSTPTLSIATLLGRARRIGAAGLVLIQVALHRSDAGLDNVLECVQILGWHVHDAPVLAVTCDTFR
uniref:Tctex1 domain-containing protein 1 n=1 Tax=Macrostomum lignano TaxID=282301 RepID=A0A1I8FYA9_9PLAT